MGGSELRSPRKVPSGLRQICRLVVRPVKSEGGCCDSGKQAEDKSGSSIPAPFAGDEPGYVHHTQGGD